MKKKNGEEGPKIDVAAVKKALAETRSERSSNGGTEGTDYSALRSDKSIETFGSGRKCECCGCALARSNPDRFCRPCDGAIQRWKDFSWLRAELEREMGEHCLNYVRARYPGKKSSPRPKGVAAGGVSNKNSA